MPGRRPWAAMAAEGLRQQQQQGGPGRSGRHLSAVASQLRIGPLQRSHNPQLELLLFLLLLLLRRRPLLASPGGAASLLSQRHFRR